MEYDKFIKSINYRVPSLYFSPYFLKNFPSEQYEIIKNFREHIERPSDEGKFINTYFVFYNPIFNKETKAKSKYLIYIKKRIHYSNYVDTNLVGNFLNKMNYENLCSIPYKECLKSLQFDNNDDFNDDENIIQISPKSPQTLFSAFPETISIQSPQDEFNYRYMGIARSFQIIEAKNTQNNDRVLRAFKLPSMYNLRILDILNREGHDASKLVRYEKSDLFKCYVKHQSSQVVYDEPIFWLFRFAIAYENKCALSLAIFAEKSMNFSLSISHRSGGRSKSALGNRSSHSPSDK